MNNYLEIVTTKGSWVEQFDPGNRTYNEVLNQVQEFLDNYDQEITIHIHMLNEHSAMIE